MKRPALATLRLSRSAAARLAVVLLLLTCTLQVVEMSHQHGVLDTAEQCLLCKADGHVALSAGEVSAPTIYLAAALFISHAGVTADPAHTLPPARGPPART